MRIAGLQKTTLLDFPGHVAATIFLAACNMRCPFCHNMNLVNMNNNAYLVGNDKKNENKSDEYTEEEIFRFLIKRQGILDGVCITGGEATLNKDLPDFILKIKELGYLVKLDTNGTNTEMIIDLIENKKIDYLAMDIKSSMTNYSVVSGLKNEGILIGNVRKSIDYLLKQEDFNYEFRTTVVREFHDKNRFLEIAEMIKGAKSYYLQNFLDSEYVPDHSLSSYSYEELLEFKKILDPYIANVGIRGIDE